ncbi:head completion/stabilization protein [Microbulbifer sp. VAAF005]|uniref:head completion/stabilization protein n=1 Tax=Microbulbifer sp. VAAF005 TaxID=3034230 RepID=UPI0024ADF5DB|nr:head completion/stabilization protein [Microbulbifer sp. VAAF005]WHI45030.1 head completion/stabilization protein [Microbulbifer sp. VAAF005]
MSFTGRSASYLETVLQNSGFFPDISLGDYQKMYSAPASLMQEKVEHLLRLAMIEINEGLEDQQALWEEEGYSTLAEVPAKLVGGKSRLLVHYQRAVFSLATAMAFREFPTVARREVGEHQAAQSLDTEQMYRAESDRAARRLRGISTNITAEII